MSTKSCIVKLLGFAEIGLGLWGIAMTAWIFIESAMAGERLGMGWLAIPPMLAVCAALPLGIFILRRRFWAWLVSLFLIPGLSGFFFFYWYMIDQKEAMRLFLVPSIVAGFGGLALLILSKKEFQKTEPSSEVHS